MRTSMPIQVTVYDPEPGPARRELARRVAEVHADFVIGTIGRLDCPVKQKQELLQGVIRAAKDVAPPG